MAGTICVWNICILMISSLLPTRGLTSYVELQVKNVLVNLVYDHVRQEVFLGGENVIIRASSSLVEVSRNVTGPVLDNPECFQDECLKGPKYLTKNRNKILLVDNNGKFLITCGNFSHGVCQKRNLATLEVIASSSDMMVASSSPSPSVAFIAPWGNTGKPAMYVGTSWPDTSANPLIERALLSVRTFSGSQLFEFVKNSYPGSNLILNRDTTGFQVKYIYGFSAGGYGFFLSVQPTTESFLQDTKVLKPFIARVCQTSEDFTSYVELPVECKGLDGKIFSLAHSAYLTKPGGDLAKALGIQASDNVLFIALLDPDTKESAVCAFSVKEINRQITVNIQKCASADGDEKLGMPWVASGNKICSKQTIQITETFCPSEAFSFSNNPYRGKLPLTANPIMRYTSSKLSAVGAMPYGNHTVVFLGTDQGQLLKVSVGNGQAIVKPYSELSISPGNDVLQMAFTRDQQHMFLLSTHKVTKVPVEECSSFSNVVDCLKPGDPFCGWCTLYKRCTRKEGCPNAGVHPSRYVTNLSDAVEFKSINPHQVALGPSVDLEIVVSNLPPLVRQGSDTYKCYINGKERSTTLEAQDTVKCSTPPRQELPSKVSDKGDLFVDLALYSTETNTSFISTKLGFYSCAAIKRCTDCAEGNYQCEWCIYQGKCTSDGKSDCPQEVIPFNQGQKAGLQGCPRLKENQTRYIPAEISTDFSLDAEYLPVAKSGYGYKCIIAVDGISISTDATRNSDKKLTCNPTQFNYGASEEKKVVNLSVLWRGSDQVYIPDSITVFLYKCWVPGTDCNLCHIVDPNFQCGWCSMKKQCVVQKACDDVSSWIPRTQRCFATPNISQIWPTAGPVTGGTEIDIHGSDLGKSFEDINNTVKVAGFKCFPDRSKYLPSIRVVCNTSASVGPTTGFVTVEVDKITGTSQQLFYYQTPEPRDFFPRRGPRSGGTLVTITGRNMNTGRNIAVWIAGSPCPVNRMKVTNTSVPCVTSGVPSRQRRANATQDTSVTLSFDGFQLVNPGGSFIFTADPTVTDIFPKKAFYSGGLHLRVTGTNLDAIETPKIFFKYPLEDNYTVAVEICNPVSSTVIVCPSPTVSSLSGNQSEVLVGFYMDNVKALLNYTMMTISPDPYFVPFADTYEVKTEYLILEGKNLEDIPIKDIYVTVEGMSCNVTSVHKTQLFCAVPSESSLPQVSDGLYTVRVAVGNLKFELGKLKYFKPDKPKQIPLYVWFAVGGGGIVLVIVIVILVCVFRRSHKKQRKHFHSLETQMTNLESKVARECREAFAELQTDITDLTSDLTTSGMPFLDFQTYMLHVLFPGFNDHPVLHRKQCALSGNWEKGLRRFSQLIYNKKFLLVFIRTLESQNSFQMKDRCNVASLLIVTFQAKMEYATEILRDLLCELIRKSVAKSHPKLLLRRTEYVAEKMLTNWLAFCMYDFLKSEAGEPLFMLFKALKQQSEKGPVDAVTGEARYSLSEDKLLRQAVEFKSQTVTVRYELNPPVSVAVLDCDTIGQVKEKILDVIFKNSPYSRRPEKEDLQLEWEQNSGRVQLLRDDDSQSLVEGEWRKLNVLSQYKVPDGASLKLTSVQSYFYSSTDSEINKRNALRVGFSPGASYSPLAVMNPDGPDEGGKLWHLVKQMDYPADRAEDARNSKMLSEIYLTRLLKTKGTLQQFVDRLFNTVFMKYRRGSSLPPAVKFLFDLLDSQARELNLTEAEVLHTWKNNSLPLRFWINIIKNPNFIFDIRKSAIVDSCLSVIAQLFMDSCSLTEHALGKDSPSNKLLYAREIPTYRQEVENYYRDIQSIAAPSVNELSDFFAELSKQHGHEFNADRALEELYGYVTKYQDQLQDALEEAELSSLASKLEHDVIAVIADD